MHSSRKTKQRIFAGRLALAAWCALCSVLAAMPLRAQQSGSSAAADAKTSDAKALDANNAEVTRVVQSALKALGERDFDGFFALWSANGPDLARRKQLTRALFEKAPRIQVQGVKVGQIAFDQQRAIANVEFDVAAFDASGAAISSADLGHLQRQFGLSKEGDNWKITHYSVPIDAFVGQLIASTSEQQKALLAGSQDWIPRNLIEPITKQSRQFSAKKNYVEAHRLAGILCELGTERADAYAMGSCYFQHGEIDATPDFASAVRYYDLAREQFREADEIKAQLVCALDAARAYRMADRPADFLRELHEAEGLRDKIQEPLMQAALHFYVADAYAQANYRKETLENLQDAAKIADHVDTTEGKKLAAQIHLRLGNVLFEVLAVDNDNLMYAINEYEKAYTFARDAGDEELKARGLAARSHTLVTWCLVRRTMGNGSGREHPAYADVCLEAVEALQFAVHGAEAYPALQIEPYWRLGDVYRYLGRMDDARQAYESAGKIATSEHEYSDIAIANHEIGKILASQRQWRESIEYYRKALEAVEHANAEAPRKSFESRIRGHSKLSHELHTDIARAYLELVREDPRQMEQAFQASEEAKSRMLLEVLTQPDEDISTLLTADENRKENDLEQSVAAARVEWERARSKAELSPEQWDAADRKFHEALRNRQLFEDQLYSVHGRKRPAEQPQLATLVDANRLLYDAAAGTAILSYVVGPDQLLLFVLTRGASPSGPAHVTPYVLALDSDTDAITQFHDKCASGQPSSKEGDLLYKALVQPAEKELSGSSPQIEHLIIVPDGSLHQLPFHALSDDSHTFLVQRYAISYAPSVTSLALMHDLARKRQRENQKQPAGATAILPMLAVGGPVMPRGYADLKFSGEEASEVASLFHSVALTGKDANAERVGKEMPRARFVHLATHGVLNEESPMRSRIILSEDGEHPDFLEVRDLMRMSLQAEMVVVSACNSAAGTQVAGEGPVGLMWALFAAKAPTTVVTLWSIDDAGTGKLMVDFYKGIKDGGLDKAAALRQAQLNMIQERAPIRLWAPFIVAGDWSN